MKTFLDYVAHDVLERYGHDLSRIAVVFPNKRASLFFNESLARQAGHPVWSPAYITISDLFRTNSPLLVGDQIKLTSDLHKCFVRCTGISETLDHFYGWGQVLLADFDDIDKNMADADKVFANLKNLHELDDVSYLSDEQKAVIRKFFQNFSADHNTELKQRFLNLWSHFGDIYHTFNRMLREQGLAYEGALYRSVAADESLTFEYDQYLFVGFNLLQKVEQQLFRRLMKQGKARFYWDFDRYYMKHNEAGHFISQYLGMFPNELDNACDELYNNFRKPKQLTYISAMTEHIQARYIAQWLKQDRRIADGKRTAVVLCNENLLPMAIHSLPDEVEKVNITTGYPLMQAPVTSLIKMLFALQTAGYVAKSGRFRLQYINKVLRHPYAQYISPRHQELYKTLNDGHVYYPSHEQLCLDEGLSLLFRWNPSPTSPRGRDRSLRPSEGERPALTMCEWLTRVLETVAGNRQQTTDNRQQTTDNGQQTVVSGSTADKSQAPNDPLFDETLFRAYTLLNRLYGLMKDGDLDIDLNTLNRLLTQLIQTTSVPFHGEPAVGLQMMGVLETRNLDFDHVLLLSCNEGNMPRGINDTSFIPYSIRKAFDLTTIDHKVAIYSYYFHRLLQRAGDVTLAYNSATEDGKTGEMSRFMLQMLVESGHQVRQYTLQAGQHTVERQRRPVVKTPEVMALLRRRFDVEKSLNTPLGSAACNKQEHSTPNTKPLLTPSAINRYISCPLSFYYNYVSQLHELEENEEDTIDGRVFGNIFHEAAHRIYNQLGSYVRRQPLEALLKNKVEIERAVDQAIKKELFDLKENDRMPDLNGLQMINREVIIRYLRQLLAIDSRLAPFTILGLEIPVMSTWTVTSGETTFQTTIGGMIDRLDSVTDKSDEQEKLRIVDYKTGKAMKKDEMPDVEAIFDNAMVEKHSNYFLQTFLYGMIAGFSDQYNPQHHKVVPALFFVQQSSRDDYDPTMSLGKRPIDDLRPYRDTFLEHLKQVIDEIFNPAIPFSPTEVTRRCEKCPFAPLCNN